MTPDKLKTIIAQKEGTEIEFKESKDSLARKVYESICAFLNRRGGHVVLGARDNGEIVGVNPVKVQEQIHSEEDAADSADHLHDVHQFRTNDHRLALLDKGARERKRLGS